jgi:hypothetical protein
MGTTPTAVNSRKYVHYMVGASAALVVVYVLSLSYFRPSESLGAAAVVPAPPVQYATYGAPTVVCGSPDPLLSNMTENKTYAKKMSYGGTTGGTQTLLTCTATDGGVIRYISLRRSKSTAPVTYRIKIDGATTPLVEINNSTDTAGETFPMEGWAFGKNIIATNLPIKFNKSLVIEAVTKPDASISASSTYVMAHAMYEPLTNEKEIPVKFLEPQFVKYETTPTVNIGNSPTVNIGNSPTVNVGGQPIRVTQ